MSSENDVDEGIQEESCNDSNEYARNKAIAIGLQFHILIMTHFREMSRSIFTLTSTMILL